MNAMDIDAPARSAISSACLASNTRKSSDCNARTFRRLQ
jgi:hypothetical protein